MHNVAVPQKAHNAQNAPKPRKKDDPNRHPQDIIDEFWKKFTTQNPGKPFTVLPENLYAKRAALSSPQKAAASQNAATSYERAAVECKAKVEKIAKTCRSRNQKYTDPYFDIGLDLRLRKIKDTLTTLVPGEDDDSAPKSVKRVEEIFEDPHFWGNGMTTDDVCQGLLGNCWLMSALSTLCNNKTFLEKVCVARDEKVGVYGFVFFRDGGWISEVIDDKLYLSKPDWYNSKRECIDWLEVKMNNPETEYRKVMQTGSKALYFAKCKDQNTTWLPLLEKAYAKAHGDYGALCSGVAGEALEDLTGGIPSDLCPTDILDKNRFWTEELMNVNKNFLFALSQMDGIHLERKGIYRGHSYSIMEARELENFRLLKIRNPWGKLGWKGPWSNGSEEWTPDRMRRLEYKFSDDGVFWISYEDLFEYFSNIDRTRLFDSDWFLTQSWTSVNVPWSVNYLDTRFRISLAKAGPVVVVLSQLDGRYFRGLEGQYSFQLQFRLHRSGEDAYLGRSERTPDRSAFIELDLEAGKYIVMIKIAASRDLSVKTPQDIVKMNCEDRREKLLAVGLSYDLAHAKGRVEESEKKRQEKLGQGRRDKRKQIAKTNFQAQKRWDLKGKLRNARLQAIKDSKQRAQKDQNGKDKDKSGEDGEKAEKDKDKVDIMIKIGENTFRSSDQVMHENGVFEHVVSGKKLRVTVEATDEEERNGDQQRRDLCETSANKDRESSLQEPSSQHQEEKRESSPVTKVSTDGEEAEAGHERAYSAQTTTPTLTPGSSTGGEQHAGGNAELQSSSDADKLADKLALSELSPPAPRPKPTFDDVSDDGLSWSSDIDAPSDTNSDLDSEPEAPEEVVTYCEKCNVEVPEPIDEKIAPMEKNPWNAVCVMGLRVYSKEAQAEVEVIRKEDDADPSKTEMLDMDDQAADATKELGKKSEEEENKLGDMGKVPDHEEESKQG